MGNEGSLSTINSFDSVEKDSITISADKLQFPQCIESTKARELWKLCSERLKSDLVHEIISELDTNDLEKSRIIISNAIVPIICLINKGYSDEDILGLPQGSYAIVNKYDLKPDTIKKIISQYKYITEDAVCKYLHIDPYIESLLNSDSSGVLRAVYDEIKTLNWFKVCSYYTKETILKYFAKEPEYLYANGKQRIEILLNDLPEISDSDIKQLFSRGNFYLNWLYYMANSKLTLLNKSAFLLQLSRFSNWQAPEHLEWIEIQYCNGGFLWPAYQVHSLFVNEYNNSDGLLLELISNEPYFGDITVIGNKLIIRLFKDVNDYLCVHPFSQEAIHVSPALTRKDCYDSFSIVERFHSGEYDCLDWLLTQSKVSFEYQSVEEEVMLCFLITNLCAAFDDYKLALKLPQEQLRTFLRFLKPGYSAAGLILELLEKLTRVQSGLPKNKSAEIIVLNGKSFKIFDFLNPAKNDELIQSFAKSREMKLI